MPHRFATRALPAGFVAAAAVYAALGAGGAGAAEARRTITLYEDLGTERFRILDERPLSPTRNLESGRFRLSTGDRGVVRGGVLDRKGGRRVGTLTGVVTVVNGTRFENASWFEHVTLTLTDGQLVAEGTYGPGTSRTVAVTGGTGAYAGARGTLTGNDGGLNTISLLP